ncbi:MAG: thermonuclease family protein [Sedimentisphaerales bacterium]|nr:thermonuclease family protein [Sedimentisphaerales bacterium]
MQTEQNKSAFAMSRRRKNGIVFLCLLAVAFLIRLDHGLIGRYRQLPAKSEEQPKTSDLEKYHGKTFTVVNVIDGDTFDIDIPECRYERTRIRLLGIDTPETGGEQTDIMYFGPEAAEFTRKSALGKAVTVYLDSPNPTRGKYGRLLAYVKLPDGGFLNEVLLTEGYAYADSRFSHSFYNKYRQLQSRARSGKKGLWQNVTPDQLPQWLQ